MKLRQWVRWTFLPAVLLSIVCLAMLVAGASAKTWQWFLPLYLIVGAPLVLHGFVRDFGELRSLWRWKKEEPDRRR